MYSKVKVHWSCLSPVVFANVRCLAMQKSYVVRITSRNGDIRGDIAGIYSKSTTKHGLRRKRREV